MGLFSFALAERQVDFSSKKSISEIKEIIKSDLEKGLVMIKSKNGDVECKLYGNTDDKIFLYAQKKSYLHTILTFWKFRIFVLEDIKNRNIQGTFKFEKTFRIVFLILIFSSIFFCCLSIFGGLFIYAQDGSEFSWWVDFGEPFSISLAVGIGAVLFAHAFAFVESSFETMTTAYIKQIAY